MLVMATGKCDKCGIEFGSGDTMQSVGVTCKKCDKQFKRCRNCKAKGCACGGKLLDAWEDFAEKKPGVRVIF